MNADLNELLERVKKATGPDREFDSDLGFALGWYAKGYDYYAWAEADGTFVESVTPKPFTASIDAALGLVERVSPDLVIHMTRLGDGSGSFQVTEAWCAETGTEVVSDFAPLDPMPGAHAVICTLLKAIISKGDQP